MSRFAKAVFFAFPSLLGPLMGTAILYGMLPDSGAVMPAKHLLPAIGLGLALVVFALDVLTEYFTHHTERPSV